MGVLFKSAIGLGAVYFAMFAPALKSDDVAATAGRCANAARLQLSDAPALRAHWAAAGCALGVSGLAAPIAAPTAPTTTLAPKRGALTEADLQVPWSGPVGTARKFPKRG